MTALRICTCRGSSQERQLWVGNIPGWGHVYFSFPKQISLLLSLQRKQHFTGSFLQSASPGPGSPLGQSSLSETAGGGSGHVGLLSPYFAAPGRSQKTSQPGPGGLQRAESLNSRRLHRGPARLRGPPPRGAGLVWVRPCQPGRVSRFQQIHRQYHLKLLNQEHVLH